MERGKQKPGERGISTDLVKYAGEIIVLKLAKSFYKYLRKMR